MEPIELLPETEPGSETEILSCGRVCDDHMREARLIQDCLLPTASLREHGIEIAFRFGPVFQVGGDFVDFFRLNQRLLQRPLPGRCCVTLYAVFDPATRTLAFSNAGLPLPLHPSATQCQHLGQGGLPSGLLASATYNQHIVQLSSGDAVLFATDGLHESLNPEGIEFCSTRMPELWAECHFKSATESLDHLFDGLQKFSNGTLPTGDIAAVVLKALA